MKLKPRPIKKDDKMLSDTFQEERCYTTSNIGKLGVERSFFLRKFFKNKARNA